MLSKLHSRVQTNLNFQLERHCSDQYDFLPELNLDLGSWKSVPDIAIYPKTEIDYANDEEWVTTPPLCTIQILSPTQSLQELLNKAREYFSHEVKSCWLVIPGLKNVYVFSDPQSYTMFQANQTLTDPALDISLDLGEVFK